MVDFESVLVVWDQLGWSYTHTQAWQSRWVEVKEMVQIIMSDIADRYDDDEWDERVDSSRHFMSGNWSH